MTWIKLDDSFPDHPKVRKAGPEASWLYIAALCHSRRFLTDGFVDAEMVPMMTTLRSSKKAIEALVSVGLWIEVEGGYEINDYSEHQQTKEMVEKQRELARERKARARRNHADVTEVSRRDASVRHADVTEVSRRSHATEKSREEKITNTPPNPLASEGGQNADLRQSSQRPNPRSQGTSPRQVAEAERLASTPCIVCKVIHDPGLTHTACIECEGVGYTPSLDDKTLDPCWTCNRTGHVAETSPA